MTVATVNPILVVAGICVIVVLCGLPLLQTYLLSKMHGVAFINVLGMRLRKISPKVILRAYTVARDNDLGLELNDLEAHFLAGGRVDKIVDAMVLAKSKGWTVGYQIFAVLDLVGEDPVQRCKDADSPDDLQLRPE